MKTKIFYYLLFFTIILTGCTHQTKDNDSKNKYNYDIAIITKDKKLLFEEQNNKLQLINTLTKDSEYGFLKEDYFNLDDSLLIKTTVIGKRALLASIDKNTLDIKLKDDDMEPYTFTYYNNKIYATNVFVDKFNMYEYDADFKQLRTKEVKNENINITNDIVIKNEKIYLLIGNVDKNNQVKNLLFVLNMNFEIEREIDLNYENGSYMRMLIDEKYAYITQNYHGKTATNEPAGSNKILKLNLETEEKTFINLDYNYPLNIYEDNDNFIINHYSLYVPNYTWTIYNKKTEEKKIIYFPDGRKDRDKPPYFTQDKYNYYFLFEDKLYKYNKNTLEETFYDLSEFGINDADIMLTKE